MVAAKRVFSDKGFAKTTMEDISKESELSTGTLYLYFKNKEELFASLSFRILQYLLIRLEHVSKEPEMGPEEKIRALKDALYDVYDFDPLIIINMFHLQSSETLMNLSPKILDEMKDMSRKSIGEMAKIFQEGIDQGIFIDAHPLALADSLWSMFSGLVLWEESKRIINPKKDFLKSTLSLAFDVFARGIKKS